MEKPLRSLFVGPVLEDGEYLPFCLSKKKKPPQNPNKNPGTLLLPTPPLVEALGKNL